MTDVGAFVEASTGAGAGTASEVSTGIRVVVMGVSGCGKSTIGALLARELGIPFVDGDALHPIENLRKMAGGTPLDDADRAPWLDRIGERLSDSCGGLVVACSALKVAYRDRIRTRCPRVVFVHLDGSRDVLAARLEGRSNHFMPSSLLDSQLATLQPLAPGERGTVIDIAPAVDEIVGAAVRDARRLSSDAAGPRHRATAEHG